MVNTSKIRTLALYTKLRKCRIELLAAVSLNVVLSCGFPELFCFLMYDRKHHKRDLSSTYERFLCGWLVIGLSDNFIGVKTRRIKCLVTATGMAENTHTFPH